MDVVMSVLSALGQALVVGAGIVVWVLALGVLIYEGGVELLRWWQERQEAHAREVDRLQEQLRHEVYGMDEEFISAVNELYRVAHKFRKE